MIWLGLDLGLPFLFCKFDCSRSNARVLRMSATPHRSLNNAILQPSIADKSIHNNVFS